MNSGEITERHVDFINSIAHKKYASGIGMPEGVHGDAQRIKHAGPMFTASPYGPLRPARDRTTGLPLLQLPEGFSYASFGWRGDLMSNGDPCPGGHRGIGVACSKEGEDIRMLLVRSHDVVFMESRHALNRQTSGGTSMLIFHNGRWIGMTPGPGGMHASHWFGITPWGSWLACDEAVCGPAGASGKQRFGVVEVRAEMRTDAHTDSGGLETHPIPGMGCFVHASLAFDPDTGTVYMTEDNPGKSGLYRYLPGPRGGYASLAQAGILQMAKLREVHNVNLAAVPVDAVYPLEWVTIPDPELDWGNAAGPSGVRVTHASGPFLQGWAQGGLRMRRGGTIRHCGGRMYIMDGSGESAARRAVWELDLKSQTLKCVHSGRTAIEGRVGDDLAVSPGGGLLLSEEDDAESLDAYGYGRRLLGLTETGDAYIFAKNNVNAGADELSAAGKTAGASGDYRSRAFGGACFDAAGRFLFVNLPVPGITFAISGPWENGPLKGN